MKGAGVYLFPESDSPHLNKKNLVMASVVGITQKTVIQLLITDSYSLKSNVITYILPFIYQAF